MRRTAGELMEQKLAGGLSVSGIYCFRRGNARLRVVASNGMGWDHVSVSLATRTPTWDEMCWVKDKFFAPEEVAFQLHPARSQYVNYHPFCLHLWRPQTEAEIAEIQADWADEWIYGDLASPGVVPLPPSELVGPLKGGA